MNGLWKSPRREPMHCPPEDEQPRGLTNSDMGAGGRSCRIPTFLVAPRARKAPPIDALGSEAQLDRDADDRAMTAVRDALSARDWRTTGQIAGLVPSSYRWRVGEVLELLLAEGAAVSSHGSSASGGPPITRWRLAR